MEQTPSALRIVKGGNPPSQYFSSGRRPPFYLVLLPTLSILIRPEFSRFTSGFPHAIEDLLMREKVRYSQLGRGYAGNPPPFGLDENQIPVLIGSKKGKRKFPSIVFSLHAFSLAYVCGTG
jgi:hypothetical protein